MKTGKKIVVLFAVFVVAAVVYFMWPMGSKEEDGVTATYQAMEDATLPVVYPTMLEKTMAPLFGHREEKAVTAGRDSLLVLPEDRKLQILVDEARDVASLSYEVRSLDLEHLIERTEITDWTEKDDGSLVVTLPIQNMLDQEVEYQLGIYAGLDDGSGVWYYARIIETENDHVGEMMALAEEYSKKTFHYESAQNLTMYMETSQTADNSSFGVVTLKNSFNQMTWGTMGADPISEPRMTLKEISGDLANIQLDYEVARTNENEETERFAVTENFTMKWTSQRIYMMDYERRMNELFTGERDLFSGKRIMIGISDGEDLYVKKSANGRFVAFVNNRELWSYDTSEGISARVFAFGGAELNDLNDVRTIRDQHDVEILNVADDGNIEFLVYGYMNRGSHEGWTGVSYNVYDAGSNTLEELFFVPASEPYAELKADLGRLAHKGENGIFYLYMNGAVYGIDLTSKEYMVVASGLNADSFAVSADHSRLAWQENTGLYDSKALHVMDLNTGSKSQIGDGTSDSYRILGFVGNDCVYGVGEDDDYIMSNGRVMGLYLKSLEIVDQNMESAMHYEKSGYYIRDVKVDESRIHITRVREKSNGFFGEVSEDTLVCNVEALPGRMDDIGWYASDVKGRVYYVQLAKDIPSTQKIRTVSPKKLVLEAGNTMNLETIASDGAIRFYAYGRGRLLGVFTEFADAAQAAYDCMGFVSAGKNTPIWIRANKPGAYFMRDVQNAVKLLERYLPEFKGQSILTEDVMLLDASGTTLNQILYFVGENMPVLVNTDAGRYQYLTGYDQGHVRLWDPLTGQSETIALDTAKERFESSGNDFICCIYVK
ncbi:MAG: hypothetical protein IJ374_06920 [Lachnospiraceae bacterium]|nr:hypothetical protein [Lachnospiraceae bacterium]